MDWHKHLEEVAILNRRIAALESQLTELRQGGEAVGEVVLESMGVGDAKVVRLHMYKEIPPVGTKLFTHPQPAIPPGYAVVPLMPTRAMEDVVNQDEWQWEDLLAAAEAITEEQYNEIASAPAIQPAIPPGYVVVKRADLEHAHQQAALAEQLIVNYAAAGLTMYGYLDDSCSAAGIAAKRIEDMLAAAPSVPVAEKDDQVSKDAARYRYLINNRLAYIAVAGGFQNPNELDDYIDMMLAAPADSKEGE